MRKILLSLIILLLPKITFASTVYINELRGSYQVEGATGACKKTTQLAGGIDYSGTPDDIKGGPWAILPSLYCLDKQAFIGEFTFPSGIKSVESAMVTIYYTHTYNPSNKNTIEKFQFSYSDIFLLGPKDNTSYRKHLWQKGFYYNDRQFTIKMTHRDVASNLSFVDNNRMLIEVLDKWRDFEYIPDDEYNSPDKYNTTKLNNKGNISVYNIDTRADIGSDIYSPAYICSGACEAGWNKRAIIGFTYHQLKNIGVYILGAKVTFQ